MRVPGGAQTALILTAVTTFASFEHYYYSGKNVHFKINLLNPVEPRAKEVHFAFSMHFLQGARKRNCSEIMPKHNRTSALGISALKSARARFFKSLAF